MTGKAVSIYDIAKLAGVSTATVSKVLNGKGSISQATRERVLDIARQEGYVASYAARTLSRGDTHTVGILAPDVSNPFFSGLVRRIGSGRNRRTLLLGGTVGHCDVAVGYARRL